MSQTPPPELPPLPPDPEGDWSTPGFSVAPEATGAGRVAAVAVWVAGGLEVVLSGCCVSLALLTALLVDQVVQQQQQALPPGITEQQVRVFAIVAASLMTAAMLLPGLALAYLGFPVRRGARTATLIALIIVLVQAVIVGLLLVLVVLSGIANLVMTGSAVDALGALMYLVVFGGLLAVLIWAIRALLRARHAATDGSPMDDDEPWNRHIPRGL